MRRMLIESDFIVKSVPLQGNEEVEAFFKLDISGNKVFQRMKRHHSFLVSSSSVAVVTDKELLLDVVENNNCYSLIVEHFTGIPVTCTLLLPPAGFTVIVMTRVLESVTRFSLLKDRVEDIFRFHQKRNK